MFLQFWCIAGIEGSGQRPKTWHATTNKERSKEIDSNSTALKGIGDVGIIGLEETRTAPTNSAMKGVFSAPGDYIHFKSQVPLHKIPVRSSLFNFFPFFQFSSSESSFPFQFLFLHIFGSRFFTFASFFSSPFFFFFFFFFLLIEFVVSINRLAFCSQ